MQVKRAFTLCVCLVLLLTMGGGILLSAFAVRANAATVQYSSALEDLEKDENFDAAQYPEIEGSADIKVVHIAEGADGELLVYTYQPGNRSNHRKARYINMSLQTASDKDLQYKLYSLTWLNSDGVFDKYVVNGFLITNEPYRNYTIASVYRIYDDTVDASSDCESIDSVQYKALPVAQTWCLYYLNDQLVYEMEHINVVKITVYATGSVLYRNGFKLYQDRCDSHYVAFSVDNFNVDKIYDADIRYTLIDYATTTYATTGTTHTEVTGTQTIEKKLSHLETGSNEGDGLLGKKYIWNRISTVEDFIRECEEDANSEFSTEELVGLNQSQFVFRFVETPNEISIALGSQVDEYSEVSEIGILRLHFLSEGKVYNLGVVGDLVGSDSDPEMVVDLLDDMQNALEDSWQKIIMLLGIILLLAFLGPFVTPLLSVLINILWFAIKAAFSAVLWVLGLPFRLIGRLFRG